MSNKYGARRHGGISAWTPERVATLKRMYDADDSLVAIGEALGLKRNTVISALAAHYPDRVHRRKSRLTSEQVDGIYRLYGEGMTYDGIAFQLELPQTSLVQTYLKRLEANDLTAFGELRRKRKASLDAKGLHMNGRPKCWTAKKQIGFERKSSMEAYTPLDAAMDYLRKFAPVKLDKATGLIIYGNARKTEEEIFALVERKKRQNEAWKVGRL